MDLSTLNENQLAAVTWNNGSLLVLAGPGSGKTRVLTYRIARILKETEGQHFKILALTFTNKAAAEMRSRVEELVPRELTRVRLTTFHSFAAELLQQHGNHIKFRPDFQILTNDADREALLDDVLKALRKDLSFSLPDHFRAAQLLPAVTRLLERCVDPGQAEMLLHQSGVENAVPLAQVYAKYREALRSTNSLDFPSLITETLELLSKHPFLVKHIRKVFKHVLVDEFQDTNHSQYQVLSLIARPDPSTLFIVADDDQIIYQWNGASPKRIQSLRKDFDVSEIQLPENYRCPPLVIELANALIGNNLNRSAGKKPLKAVKRDGSSNDVVRIYGFNKVEDEAHWIAKEIASKSHSERCECAILARTKKLLELAGEKLKDAGLTAYFAARKDEFTSAPLRMLHSILRLVNSKEDKQSLARLSKAFYELEGLQVNLSDVLSLSSADGMDLMHAWLIEVQSRNGLEESTRALLTSGIAPLLKNLNYRSFAENLFAWAEAHMDTHEQLQDISIEFNEERSVWGQLVAEVDKKFEGEEVGLHQLLHELDLTSKTPPMPNDAIPCFTIHASKGMEFGQVYLMGLVEDQLPSWAAVKKGDQSIEMQEERRNCFVAITRAQESLTMTYSAEVFGWRKAPSRFLSEMGISL